MDPLHVLQDAARTYGRHVFSGYFAGTLKLYDDAGRKVAEVMVPPCMAPTEPFAPEVRPGWDFSRKVPRFDGQEHAITGRPLTVLRALAGASGPVPVEELREAWDGYQASDSTIRGTVADLRKRLESLWPEWEGDVIESTGAGYVLHVR